MPDKPMQLYILQKVYILQEQIDLKNQIVFICEQFSSRNTTSRIVGLSLRPTEIIALGSRLVGDWK